MQVPANIDDFIKIAQALLYLAGLLGLGALAAAWLRGQWLAFKGKAASDGVHNLADVFIALFGERVDRIIEMIDKGDIEGAKLRLAKLSGNLGRKG